MAVNGTSSKRKEADSGSGSDSTLGIRTAIVDIKRPKSPSEKQEVDSE